MQRPFTRRPRTNAARGATPMIARAPARAPLIAAVLLQRAAGNQATLRLLNINTIGPALLQRQPTSTTAGTPQTTDYREFVLSTIRALNLGAATYSDPNVIMTRAIFDRVIDAWHRMVVSQEGIIDTSLRRDAALKADLHAAYIAAIRVLVRRAAAPLGQTETDILRENRGRIPMWAWPTPHRLVAGTSVPVPAGLTADRRRNFRFTVNGVRVVVRPDTFNRRLRKSAQTQTAFSWSRPGATFSAARPRRVTRIGALEGPRLTIRVTYRRRGTAGNPSAYGRGTTAEDVAGGAVTPHSLTLGFHEGSHGLDAIEFVTNNPLPTFTGTVGMTRAEWNAAGRQFDADMSAYNDRLQQFQTRQGDCVGFTIDDFHRQQQAALPRRRRARIVLECGP
jgi:hypothetical protein